MSPTFEPANPSHESTHDASLAAILVPAACLGGALVGAFETMGGGGAAALVARSANLVAGAAVLLALVELAGSALFVWATRRLAAGGWSPAVANAFVGAVLATPMCAWLLAAIFSGRRLTQIPGRPILLMAGLLALLALTFSAIGAASVRFSWPRRRRLVSRYGLPAGAGLLGAIPCLLWLDGHVLARRYAWFHLSLELLIAVTAQLGIVLAALDGRWRGRMFGGRRGWLLPGGLVTLSLLGAAWTAKGLWGAGGEHDRAAIFSRGGVVAAVLDHLRLRTDESAPHPSIEPAPPAALGAGPFAGCDVVLITVDALRADHLGLHGYKRPTSPRIDALARQSTVFERAYSSSPHTSFAIASMLTGRNAFPLARAGLLGSLPTLPDAFRSAGYRTVGLFPPAVFFVEGEHFQVLAERRYGFEAVRFESLEENRDAVARTDQAIEVLRRTDGRPLFMWVHHFGPHEPYVAHGAGFGLKEIDRYDDEIAWVDREVGRLLDHLESRGRPAIVVLTADHGEEFGDHGGAYHGTSLYDEQIRVPLLIRVPNGSPQRLTTAVSTLDLGPTLLGLAAVPWSAPLDGVDRQPEILGTPPVGSPRPVFAEVESWKAAMVDGRKLICDVARDFCLLFDLASDPAEKVNVAARRRREVSELRRDLEGWLRGAPPDGAPTAGSGAASLLWAAQRWEKSSVSALGSVIGARSGAAVADRRAAARLLARAPSPEQRSALEQAWREDADEVVRSWAAIGLIALGDRRPVPGLLEAGAVAAGDRELEAHRGLALERAGHREEAIPLMTHALPGIADVNLRCRVLAALGRANDPRATAALITAYDHIRSRICVSEALGEARDPATIPFLVARLRDDPYTTVRASVARALGLAGDRAALPALLEVFQRDTEEVVVAAAARALADLGAALSVGGARRLPRPPAARELWLVTAPGQEAPRVRLATASGTSLRAEVYTSVARDAHAFALPPAGSPFLWVSRPARFALFR